MNNLLPNQQLAKSHLSEWRVGALFMKMGTGKTRVAVELANSVPDVDLLVWVAPLRTIEPKDKSVQSIKKEIDKWGGFRTAREVIYIGCETIGSSDRRYLQLFAKVRVAPKCFIIVDESIKIKNLDAKRTQRILELGKMAAHKLILNGTPITRDLLDLYPQMQFLSPKILNMELAQFKNVFCKYTTIKRYSSGYGRAYTKEFITGYANIDYLYSLIRHYVFECDLELNIRQLYEDKHYKIDDDAKEIYYKLKEKYLDDEMLQFKNNNIFLEMTQKMQHEYCCTESKFEAVAEWLKDNNLDQSKVIIYHKFINSGEELRRRFPRATILSLQADCRSFNLQNLPYTIYFDKTFDYGDMEQSSHRNYRVGQEQDVRYLSLTGDVGLENIIDKNIEKKISMSEYFKKISKKQLKEVL